MASAMTENVIVHSVASFSFMNSEKKLVEGCTVRYAITENFEPYADDTLKGYKPAKVSIPLSDFHRFPIVPGIYEIAMDKNVDSEGKVTLTPKTFTFVCGINVTRAGTGNKLQLGSKETS